MAKHGEELSESWAHITGWIILLLSCSSTVAFPDTVILLGTAVSEVPKLLRTGGVGVISAEQVLCRIRNWLQYRVLFAKAL